MSKNLIPDEKLPFDPRMCWEQYANTLSYVSFMQEDENIEQACNEAMEKCAELFEEFYSAEDRMLHLAMLGYLAMDIAANVSMMINRVQLHNEINSIENEEKNETE